MKVRCCGSLGVGCEGAKDMTGDNAGLRLRVRAPRLASDCNDSCQSACTFDNGCDAYIQ
jgi:hypothetical protein